MTHRSLWFVQWLMFVWLVTASQAQAQNTLKTLPQAQLSAQASELEQAYTDLERALELALSSSKTQDVLAKLAPEFSARDAQRAGVLNAQSWLAQAAITRPQARLVSDLQVQLSPEGSTAMVSFYLLEPSVDKQPARTLFVVDVWQHKPRVLVSRYTSQVRQIPSSRRPDGKE